MALALALSRDTAVVGTDGDRAIPRGRWRARIRTARHHRTLIVRIANLMALLASPTFQALRNDWNDD